MIIETLYRQLRREVPQSYRDFVLERFEASMVFRTGEMSAHVKHTLPYDRFLPYPQILILSKHRGIPYVLQAGEFESAQMFTLMLFLQRKNKTWASTLPQILFLDPVQAAPEHARCAVQQLDDSVLSEKEVYESETMLIGAVRWYLDPFLFLLNQKDVTVRRHGHGHGPTKGRRDFTYHTLHVGQHQHQRPLDHTYRPATDTRCAPRRHEVRSHMRTLRGGREVRVRAHFRGTDGFVFKDYRL